MRRKRKRKRRGPDPIVDRLPLHYGHVTRRTLRGLIAVIAPSREVFGLPPKGPGPVLRTVLSFIPFLPFPLRFSLPFGLLLFEMAPVFFGFGRRRFTSLDHAQGTEYMRRWEHGPPPLVQVYAAFHALVLCAFYEQPEVLRALEVDWESRAQELLERRARLLGVAGTDVSGEQGVRERAPVE